MKDEEKTKQRLIEELVELRQRVAASQALESGRPQVDGILQESEIRFRQLAENIREVFYLSNLRSPQMIYISPGYEAIWGRSCQSLYEDPISFVTAIHPTDRDRVMMALDKQLRGEATEEVYQREFGIKKLY